MEERRVASACLRTLTGSHQVADFPTLIVGELRLVSWVAALLAGALQTGAGTLTDHLTLKLGKDADYLHHHAPGRVVVSMSSVRDRNPAPAVVLIFSMMVSRSFSDRDS